MAHDLGLVGSGLQIGMTGSLDGIGFVATIEVRGAGGADGLGGLCDGVALGSFTAASRRC